MTFNFRFKTFNLKKGIMMIELMLALTIVALVLVALTSATTVALRNSKHAHNIVLANQYAQQALEITRQKRNEADIWQDFISDYAGCRDLGLWTSCATCPNAGASPNLGIFYRCLNIVDLINSVEVTVFVSWIESGRSHTVKAATILSKWE